MNDLGVAVERGEHRSPLELLSIVDKRDWRDIHIVIFI